MPPHKTIFHPFIQALCNEFPEIRREMEAELEIQGLLHMQMGVFERCSLEAFRRGEIELVQRYFNFVEKSLDGADAKLVNAFHVSYAEGFAWGTPHDKSARDLMPPRLAAVFDAMTSWPQSPSSHKAI